MFIPYRSRPKATAWPALTPRGTSSRTSAPSRRPRPLTEMGRTWAMATIGMKAIIADQPTWMPMA